MEGFVIGSVAGLTLVIWAISWFVRTASRQASEAKENAPQVLDGVFNGDSLVTYTSGFAALDYEAVIMGAVERGYDLVSQGGRNGYGMEKLIFRKVD